MKPEKNYSEFELKPQKYYPERGYTTWTLNQNRPGPIGIWGDILNAMEKKVEGKENKSVYVLGISRGDCEYLGYSVKTLEEKIRNFRGIKEIHPINNLITIAIIGDKRKAKRVAERLYACTGLEVGVVKYDKDEWAFGTYALLRMAIREAIKKGENIHFYNPDTDSLEGELKRLRKLLKKKKKQT
ncbi:hypothetical protein DRJ19_04315 [Candidatus Woesearchaeota archaeon]|nr:MAG: hypothetical protein DRJ19_04315 [Candidatus Woesearchaeota archaeon]